MPARDRDHRPHDHVHEPPRPERQVGAPSALDELRDRLGGAGAAAWLSGAPLACGEHVVQATLTVGSASDPAEHEADRAADAILAGRPASVGADSTVRRSAAGSGHGFDAGASLTSALDAASGGGSPLPVPFQQRAEHGLGTDLSGVRVHDDARAHGLAGSMSALAFTRGPDVFLGERAPAPGTPAGDRLLAHEVAHVAQQQGVTDSPVRRKVALEGTDWTTVTSFTVFPGGSSGLSAAASDGTSSVVVKVNQISGNDVAVASALHARTAAAAARSGGSGPYSVSAPVSRVADATEAAAIRAAIKRNPPSLGTANEQKFLDAYEKGDILLMQYGAGEDFQDVVRSGQHGPDAADSIVQALIHDAAPVLTLARTAGVDIVMGAADRMRQYFNGQNFKYDTATKTFHLTDNATKSDIGLLHGGGGTARQAFDEWVKSPYGGAGARDLAGYAEGIFKAFFADDFNSFVHQLRHPDRKQQRALQAQVQDQVRQNAPRIRATLLTGVEQGVAEVRRQLTDPVGLSSGTSPAARLDVVTALVARRLFMEGRDADRAWDEATQQAAPILRVADKVGSSRRRRIAGGATEQAAQAHVEKKETVLRMLEGLDDPLRVPPPPGKSGTLRRAAALVSDKQAQKVAAKDRQRQEYVGQVEQVDRVVRWRTGRTQDVSQSLDQLARDVDGGRTSRAAAAQVGPVVDAKARSVIAKSDVVLKHVNAWRAVKTKNRDYQRALISLGQSAEWLEEVTEEFREVVERTKQSVAKRVTPVARPLRR